MTYGWSSPNSTSTDFSEFSHLVLEHELRKVVLKINTNKTKGFGMTGYHTIPVGNNKQLQLMVATNFMPLDTLASRYADTCCVQIRQQAYKDETNGPVLSRNKLRD